MSDRNNSQELHAVFFPHPLLWVAVALQWACVLAAAKISNFTILPMMDWSVQAGVLAGMLAGGWYVRNKWPNVTRVLFGLVVFYISGLGGVAMSYVTTYAGFPLADALLNDMDRVLGFDWRAHVAWVNESPALRQLLKWGYESIGEVFIFSMATLIAARRFDRLAEFFVVLFLCIVAMNILAWLLPAIGPYTYLAPDDSVIGNMPSKAGRYWLDHFTALRAGEMNAVTLGDTTGLIAFPSFHAMAAILTTWAVRRMPMFWPLVYINGFMLISTISMGGHYLVDILASVVLIVLAVLGVRWFRKAEWRFYPPAALAGMRRKAESRTLSSQN